MRVLLVFALGVVTGLRTHRLYLAYVQGASWREFWQLETQPIYCATCQRNGIYFAHWHRHHRVAAR